MCVIKRKDRQKEILVKRPILKPGFDSHPCSIGKWLSSNNHHAKPRLKGIGAAPALFKQNERRL